jgi:Uncharacterized conserved protein
MKRHFRPPVWAWLLAAFGLAAFLALGFWQLQRAQEKKQLIRSFEAAAAQHPRQLAAGAHQQPGLHFVAAQAQGVYLHRQILLAGQSHGDDPGYDVLTPLRLDDGAVLLVNRGFVAGTPMSGSLPTPAIPDGRQQVHGLWRPLPKPALQLGPTDSCHHQRPWPRLLTYPTDADLRCLYGAQLLPGELLLAPGVQGGFVRDWHPSFGVSPQRHYAYAAQWFTFAITLIVLFLVLNLKKRS